MNIRTVMKQFTSIGLSAVLSTGIVISAQAAPGTLADSPLFLTNYPQANIFFMLDDSGSMDWDNMVDSGSSGLPSMGGWTGNYYVLPAWNNNYDVAYFNSGNGCYNGSNIECFPYVTPSPAALPNDSWRVRNYQFNSLYYNPAVTYTPWEGSDATGTALYTNVTATAALVDPGNPGQGTINLTQTINFRGYAPSLGNWYDDSIFPAHHYTWTDTNTDGVVDGNDAHTLVQIVPATTCYTGSAARCVCASTPTCT